MRSGFLFLLFLLPFPCGCMCLPVHKMGANQHNKAEEKNQSSLVADNVKLSPLKYGQKIPEAVLVNQDGKEIKLSDYNGKVLVLTFIYTRCNIQTMCPMATSKLSEVREKIAKSDTRPVHFLIISFDAVYDKPDKLKEFSKQYKIDSSMFEFASADPKTIGNLARAFNTYYRNDQPGVFSHNIIVSLIDKNGIFCDDFFGTEWEIEEMISAIKEVLGK